MIVSVYYQNISKKDWANVSKGVGDESVGLRFFSSNNIIEKIGDLDLLDKNDVEKVIEFCAKSGVQVWGAPDSALPYMKDMKSGDFLLICDQENIRYAGQVLFRFSKNIRSLSNFIWNEDKFSNIILLNGIIVSYSWSRFKRDLSYSENYFLKGVMKKVKPDKIIASSYENEDNFIANIMCSGIGEFNIFEKNLEKTIDSFRFVKVRQFQRKFREELLAKQGPKCAVCEISYPEVLEAAHIIPKYNQGSDECDNGIVFCSLHHKMFDAGMFCINPDTYDISIKNSYTHEGLKISNRNLNFLRELVKYSYVEWRWRDWTAIS